MDPVALLAGVQHQGDACQKQTSLSGSNPKSNLKFQHVRNGEISITMLMIQ
jgi:hypothetical protein